MLCARTLRVAATLTLAQLALGSVAACSASVDATSSNRSIASAADASAASTLPADAVPTNWEPGVPYVSVLYRCDGSLPEAQHFIIPDGKSVQFNVGRGETMYFTVFGPFRGTDPDNGGTVERLFMHFVLGGTDATISNAPSVGALTIHGRPSGENNNGPIISLESGWLWSSHDAPENWGEAIADPPQIGSALSASRPVSERVTSDIIVTWSIYNLINLTSSMAGADATEIIAYINGAEDEVHSREDGAHAYMHYPNTDRFQVVNTASVDYTMYARRAAAGAPNLGSSPASGIVRYAEDRVAAIVENSPGEPDCDPSDDADDAAP